MGKSVPKKGKAKVAEDEADLRHIGDAGSPRMVPSGLSKFRYRNLGSA